MLSSTLVALALVCSVAAAEVTSGRMMYRGPKRRSSLRRRCKAKVKAATVQVPASGNSTYNINGMTGTTPATNTSNAAPATVGSQQDQQSKSVAAGFGVQDTKTASTSNDNFLKRNCVHWGWIPADNQKTTTGLQMTPKEINNMVGTPAKFFGAYAHIDARKYKKGQSNTFFDGKEVLGWIDYLKGTGSTAILSVMPIYGFGGMTDSDNTQAVQLANVVKQFDNAGIPVYLRWGHEMNWYFLPKTDDDNTGSAFYIGTPQDYITGWKVVTKAVRAAVPSVKMFWSPNIGSMDDYAKYYPGKEFVDAVGVDYYPKNDFGNLFSHVQNIHDTYAKANNVEFHLGETGSTDSDITKRVAWAQVTTSQASCKALSNLVGIHYFEFNKERVLTILRECNKSADFLNILATTPSAYRAEFRLTASPSNAAMFSQMMKSS